MSMNLEKLREEIAELVHDAICRGGMYPDNSERAADEIIEAIKRDPSIATALRFTDLHRQAGNVVGDPKIKPQAKGS